MRPKSILLLALIAVSVSFMAFLLLESQATNLTCEKGTGCTEPDKPGTRTEKGVLESPESHLIVSKN